MGYVIGLTHTIDAAHRVVGHEGGRGKCARLHGHTYTFDVEVEGFSLQEIGFVVDFGVIKRVLDEWDHRTLLWDEDPLMFNQAGQSIRLPFNPTAENLARHVAERIADVAVADGVQIQRVTVVCRETPKSRASYTEDVASYRRRVAA